ncbi:MAG: sulfite oxidase [Candidatus Obscuribacterales bacterium]|nr:sulfite oxidase [Candidatus Obscuribacterales bacterium]
MDEREVKGGALASPVTVGAVAGGDPCGLILREKSPLNLESRPEHLETFITENNKFYVRNHFPVPELDLSGWKLTLEGCVERTVDLSYDELLRLPSRTVAFTMECAGNSRTFLNGAKGLQWAAGALGTAQWTGVPLFEVLKICGVSSDAVEVVFEGADSGIPTDDPSIKEAISFSRSLSMEEAMSPDVLLAYKMNGEPLSALHGFPVRLVVPGFYGMASVKWLQRIAVANRRFHGYYQTVDYAFLNSEDAEGARRPIKSLQVKSMLIHPHESESIVRDSRYRLYGAAWSAGEIAKVDVSCDEGKSWHAAKLLGESVSNCWRFFEFDWVAPSQPGVCTLLTRATDAAGNCQPFEHDDNCGSYVINFVTSVHVNIE